jgi:hypothetical protein
MSIHECPYIVKLKCRNCARLIPNIVGRKNKPGYITIKFNPVASVAPPSPLTKRMQDQVQAAAQKWTGTVGKTGKAKKKRTKKQQEHVGGGLFRVSQLAKKWAVSADLIRKLFENEPGVMRIGNPNPRRKRRYVTLRIPEAIADRVLRRLSS